MTIPQFTHNATLKLFLIGVLALFLLIPTLWLDNLVSERKHYSQEAAEEVYTMWGGPQEIGSPILVLPYQYSCYVEVARKRKTNEGWVEEPISKKSNCVGYAKLYPEKLHISGDLPSTQRKKGIFQIPLYTASILYDFHYATPDWNRIGVDPTNIAWDEAFIAIDIKDTRGLLGEPLLHAEGQAQVFNNDHIPGKPLESGLIASLPHAKKWMESQKPLQIEIHTQGAEYFSLYPVAREAKVNLQSDWTSPAFHGKYLPNQRSIGANGFKASWNLLALNHGINLAWTGKTEKTNEIELGFKQVQPINLYSMTDRAIKYVILFIALTFILCYFAERLTGTSIHVLQYMLIGISLLLFYTLLLSLSENVGFGIAYAIATLAIAIQIALFIYKIMGSRVTALIAMAVLSALYGFLYVLLTLEDHALLAGSVGLFTILGSLMYISTRIPSKP